MRAAMKASRGTVYMTVYGAYVHMCTTTYNNIHAQHVHVHVTCTCDMCMYMLYVRNAKDPMQTCVTK